MDLIPKEEVSSINKKVIFIGAGVLVVVALSAFFVFRSPNESNLGAGNGTVNNATGTNNGQQGTDTYAPISGGVVVPGVDSPTDSEVANPTEVKAIGAGGIIDQRNFQVEIKNDAVSPQKIIVYAGDLVNIAFTSADKQYDFFQPENGMSWTVSKEKPIALTFQSPNIGQFTFYCASCGGPDKGPVGYIVVVPK